MTFPKSKCDICDTDILAADGIVACYPFGRYVRSLYDAAAEERSDDDVLRVADEATCEAIAGGEYGTFIKHVTRCYFYQFEGLYNNGHVEDVGAKRDSKRQFAERERKRFDASHRLRTLLTRPLPVADLYMLVHDECLPEDIRDGVYPIDLNRIDTPAKGIEWTIHLAEKVTWNPQGWVCILEDLFGRSHT